MHSNDSFFSESPVWQRVVRIVSIETAKLTSPSKEDGVVVVVVVIQNGIRHGNVMLRQNLLLVPNSCFSKTDSLSKGEGWSLTDGGH